ncbi:biopolymer transporter ExbD [Mucilaginibacter koreensis]
MAELAVSQKPGGRRTASLRVDLTAMVDLAFLLVTFFMLTTTLSKPRAMDLTMPVGEKSDPVAQSRSVTLCLGSNNKLYLYRGVLENPIGTPQVIDLMRNNLRHVLIDLRNQIKAETGKSAIVIVKPGAHSKYGNLVNTLDELNITQNTTYAITDITNKEVDILKARQLN